MPFTSIRKLSCVSLLPEGLMGPKLYRSGKRYKDVALPGLLNGTKMWMLSSNVFNYGPIFFSDGAL